jgi:hypothetical protein
LPAGPRSRRFSTPPRRTSYGSSYNDLVVVIELAHESADGKTGTYALPLFLRVRPLDPPRGTENEGGSPDPTSGGVSR